MKIDQVKVYMYPMIIGAFLILMGLFTKVPGAALTTFESLDGDHAKHYVFDNEYSAIDEYVGGDAYNYIIGASLVAGKTSGAMATKAIYIAGGAICICFGIVLMEKQKKENATGEMKSEKTEIPHDGAPYVEVSFNGAESVEEAAEPVAAEKVE